MQEANEAMDANAYTRQLYTAFGVGLSSTSVRSPIVSVFDAEQCLEQGRASDKMSERFTQWEQENFC